jgi:hypothetical protein
MGSLVSGNVRVLLANQGKRLLRWANTPWKWFRRASRTQMFDRGIERLIALTRLDRQASD